MPPIFIGVNEEQPTANSNTKKAAAKTDESKDPTMEMSSVSQGSLVETAMSSPSSESTGSTAETGSTESSKSTESTESTENSAEILSSMESLTGETVENTETDSKKTATDNADKEGHSKDEDPNGCIVVEGTLDTCKFLPFNSQVLDLSRYYGLKQCTFNYVRFSKVQLWKSFDAVTGSLSKPLNIPDNLDLKKSFTDSGGTVFDSVRDGMEVVGDFANSILKDAKVDAEFTSDKSVMSSVMIGNCDQILVRKNKKKCRPILIGKFCPSRVETILNNNGFFTELLVRLNLGTLYSSDSYEVTKGEKHTLEHLSNLCTHMVLNRCNNGYISCGFQTRFVEITHANYSRESYGSLFLKLMISPPIGLSGGKKGLLSSLIAVSMKCYKSTSALVVPTLDSINNNAVPSGEFSLVMQTMPEPKTCSLNKYETPRMGKIKWWKMKRSNEIAASVSLTTDDAKEVTGLLHLNKEPSDLASRSAGTELSLLKGLQSTPEKLVSKSPLAAFFKCCSYRSSGNEIAFAELENEARVYEYLEKLNVPGVPLRYAYGDLFGMVKVLAIEPVGRPLTKRDLTEEAVEQIKQIVSELHSHNLLHNDIRLSNFYVNSEMKIHITNFSKTRLYSRLHELITNGEIEQMNKMLSQT